jgi:hypothetical protein
MDLLIRLERERPPVGEVVVVAGSNTGVTGSGASFVGWLGLIRVLEDLVSAPPEAPGP